MSDVPVDTMCRTRVQEMLEVNAQKLQADFCPPLDTTVVAAFMGDYFHGVDTIDSERLQNLRDHLSTLAASAAADQVDELAGLRNGDGKDASASINGSLGSDSLFDSCGDARSSSSSSTPSQTATRDQHASAFEFLRASFPYLPPDSLKAKLDNEESYGSFDMERLVEELLSEDYVKELEERGLEDEETSQGDMDKWYEVSVKSAKSNTIAKIAPGQRKAKKKGRTFAINDVRQRHQPDYRKVASTHTAGDPWSQVLSVSSYLESLLSVPSSFFSSYFHKPEYSTPSDALRAALLSITGQRKEQITAEYATVLNLLELLTASNDCEVYDDEAYSDAELVLKATDGRADVALDVLRLLQDLDRDKDGSQEMGLYHTPVSPLFSTPGIATPAASPGLAPWTSGENSLGSQTQTPALPYVPPTQAIKLRPPPAPNENKWQQVKVRPKKSDVDPLAAFIPAYNAQNVPRRKGKAIPFADASRGGVSAVQSRREAAMGGYRARIEAARDKRNQMLRTASRHWAGGNARTRGGEVALYYAMQAQEHQKEARDLQVQAAREFVQGKRHEHEKRDTIDLHYCTVAESQLIVKEVLQEGWVSPTRPLRIITGRGSHSHGGVGVIQPALKKTLEQDGWDVVKEELGLVVRGPRRR